MQTGNRIIQTGNGIIQTGNGIIQTGNGIISPTSRHMIKTYLAHADGGPCSRVCIR